MKRLLLILYFIVFALQGCAHQGWTHPDKNKQYWVDHKECFKSSFHWATLVVPPVGGYITGKNFEKCMKEKGWVEK